MSPGNPATPEIPPQPLVCPAFPGFALDTLQDWRENCLVSDVGDLKNIVQYANCTFDNYAHQTFPHGTEKASCLLPGETTPSMMTGVPLLPSKVSKGIVCFDNFKITSDRLCIFQDFSIGNTSVEQMASLSVSEAELESKLEMIIEGAKSDAPSSSLNGKMLCFGHGDKSSVGWTYMHVFDPPLDPTKYPDRLNDTNAYCRPYSWSVAADLATDITKRMSSMKCGRMRLAGN
jgi:hypothetical protein